MTMAGFQRDWFSSVMSRQAVVPAGVLATPVRMQLIVEMTWTRLVAAMVELFPRLHEALGLDRFRALALAYLDAHPSRVHDLDDIGIGLADFLVSHPKESSWASLAAFESAKTRTFRALNDPSGVSSATMTPAQLMASAVRLSAAAAMINVTGMVAEHLGLPAEDMMLCMYRRHDVVHWRRINVIEQACVRTLQPGSLSFIELCEQLANQGHEPGDVALHLAKLQGDDIVSLHLSLESP